MKLEFNKTKEERKALVKTISEIMGTKARYMGMPTMNYEVDRFTITRDGTVEFDGRTDSEDIETLLEKLAEKGFICEDKELTAQMENGQHSETVGLTVAIPKEEVDLDKLNALLLAKGNLIQKALGSECLEYETSAYEVRFPWFGKVNPDEAMAYTRFIAALCKMTIKQKRINITEKKVENDKYTFRCFLLRLGFIGQEFKADRKILLRNLQGSSAFKNGGANHEVSE